MGVLVASAGFAWGAMHGVAEPEVKAEVKAEVKTAAAGTFEYSRVRDERDGERVILEIASRAFIAQDGTGPTVHLVGAIHIGDKAYYDGLQTFLNEHDVVLYEGVKPALKDDLGDASQAFRVKITASRQRFLARVITREEQRKGALPDSVEGLISSMKGTTARLTAASKNDAWGFPIQYVRHDGGGFDLVSLGADAKPGGEGADADLKFSDQKPLTSDEIESIGQGIQIKLASALGLEYQGASINYDRLNWRNSDMSIDEVQRRAREQGASADSLLSMIEGKSMSARVVGFLLGFVKASPQMQLVVKVMMAETLANAEKALDVAGQAREEGKKPSRMERQMAEMAKLMTVIIDDRNRVVLDDLKRIIETEPKVRTIAIFYGAGHLPKMEASLRDEFHMKDVEGGERWFPAIDIDLTAVPGGVQQAKQMRGMMKSMLEGRGTQP